MPNMHVHQFEGNTTCTDHAHILSGISGPAVYLPTGNHVHLIRGKTNFMDNHFHEYEVYSGPNVELPQGYHVHNINLQTFTADGHTHMFFGYDMASVYERAH